MNYNEMVQSYKAKMREFKEEEMCRCIRLRTLYDKLFCLEGELTERHKASKIAEWCGGDETELGLINSPVDYVMKEVRRIKMLIRVMCEPRKDSDITADMIVAARNYPIENIVTVKRGFALCPSHEDKKPSMFTKGNFGHCFVCGYTGDCIDIYAKVHGTDFKTTVVLLCR